MFTSNNLRFDLWIATDFIYYRRGSIFHLYSMKEALYILHVKDLIINTVYIFKLWYDPCLSVAEHGAPELPRPLMWSCRHLRK